MICILIFLVEVSQRKWDNQNELTPTTVKSHGPHFQGGLRAVLAMGSFRVNVGPKFGEVI